MKNKLWLFQLPFVVLFTGAFYLSEQGNEGRLQNQLVRESLRRVSSTLTDIKFKLRGPIPPKNKIVVVEIDQTAIESFGRWPWHRDHTAKLIEKSFDAGAKVVGLDIVFSEADQRVPEPLANFLSTQKMGDIATAFETDRALEDAIRKHADNLVIGWTSESVCSPFYDPTGICQEVTNPDAIKQMEEFHTEKFSFSEARLPENFNPQRTPIVSFVTMLPNLQLYTDAAKHAGYFNTEQDPDGHIRRGGLLMIGNRRPYPSLPLEMARVGLGEDLTVEIDADMRVKTMGFRKSGRMLPVNPVGLVEGNYRGPGRTFTYVSAADVMKDDDKIEDVLNRKLAGVSKAEVLKDAYVLIGVSALGAFDMRAFPFDSNVPGVEGHANLLDNILSNDFLVRYHEARGSIWIFLLMIVGALLFAFMTQKLESVPALLFFIIVFAGFGVVDLKVLFSRNINWDTSFLYLEFFTIFLCTLAAKYVMEERSKKFVKGAFAKYVAPAVVDSIMMDPSKLVVGGEKRELTIMFSDIRSFTSFSEKMDAKALSSFLNDYLGIMTEIVFANEGTLDKYIGDAVMAFWGAPLPQPRHAENACRAAAQMMQALAKNHERFKTQYGVDVAIGIGMNSGVVSVGNMGSQNNFSYTVIGDHVNLASRLEGLTKAYGAGILTSRFTFDAITEAKGTQPRHRIVDHVKVKGKKKAVELIQVLETDMSEEGLRLFEEGRQLYTRQKWDEAMEKMRAANRLLAATSDAMDGPCGVYLERCEEFKKNPPGVDWDGSWEMHSK